MKKILKKLNAKRDEQRALGKKGFTLIELLVVIAILGILVLLAAPSFLGYTKDANVSTMKADAKVLANSALVYNIDNEEWPAGEASTVEIPGVTGTLSEIDADALSNHVQTLKNGGITAGSYDNYVIATSGDEEGNVYSKTAVEDKDGNEHYGVNTVVPAE